MKRNVLQVFEQTVDKYSYKVAVKDENHSYTYGQLRERARRVGSVLSQYEREKEPIIVLTDRTVDSVVMFLGVLYSGNFYVPVDEGVPESRLETLCASIRPAIILAKEKNVGKLQRLEKDIKGLLYEDLLNGNEDIKRINTIVNNIIDVDPLYMVFTSGSTGIPKGVIKTHRSVLSFEEAFIKLFGFSEQDVFGNQAAFDFDVSAKDIYTTFFVGGTLCLIPKKCFMIPVKLIPFLNEHKVTTLIWSVSAIVFAVDARCFNSGKPEYIDKILFSGEVLPVRILNTWKEKLPNATYVNLYAPSEVTGNCLYHVIKEDLNEDEQIPLGEVFPNMDVLILDEHGNRIQEGEKGEIYVRGAFLASGYYMNPEKTSAVFIQNPLHNSYIDLVYKTGDLAEIKNGMLYYVCRIDNQVKHMGHRIELEELESVANNISGVTRSCAFLDKDKEKIVFVVETEDIGKQVILGELRKKLPKYMLPHRICIVKCLPTNDHGKIDRSVIKKKYEQGEI